MIFETIMIACVVTVAVAAFLPESITDSDSILHLLAWLGYPLKFIVYWVIQNSIGRFIPPALVLAPQLTRVASSGTESLYSEWEISTLKQSWWRLQSVELQVKSEGKDWKTVYIGDETEFLIERLAEKTKYSIRIRSVVAGKPSEWTNYKDQVWTLSSRSVGGGTTGPLTNGQEYSWTQDDTDVELKVPVSEGVKRTLVSVVVKSRSISLKIGNEVILSGDLAKEALADECFWVIADGYVVVSLVKKDRMTNWPSVITGHPPIDLF